MAQYRPLIMLALGITFIYWIISLHSAPYPYPKNITYAQDVIFGYPGFLSPDEVFIYVQDGWVYLTAIWKEYEAGPVDDVRANIWWFAGLIKQYKRPLHPLLLPENKVNPNNKWKLLYIHRLRGPITHISSYFHKNTLNPTSDSEYNENNALAILYQIQADEEIHYTLRLYNLGEVESIEGDLDNPADCKKNSHNTCHLVPPFKYQDITFPGTTKIMSFHVENSSPDDAKFRIIKLPRNIFDISKKKNDALTIKSSEAGPFLRFTKQEILARKTATFRRVYAVPGVIRVMQVEITANEESWTFQVTVIHNSSLSEDASGPRVSNWRQKKLIAITFVAIFLMIKQYTPSVTKKADYEQFDFVSGLALTSPVPIPRPIVVTARNVTTICIALNNVLFTFDYSDTTLTDSKQDSQSKEAYVVRREYLPVLEEWPFQIIEAEINSKGNLLLLVTQENYILIYKRGTADIHRFPLLSSSARAKNGWFDKPTEENHHDRTTNNEANANGENWELKMVITLPYLDFISQSELDIIAVKSINISRVYVDNIEKNVTGNVLLIIFDNGNVATFHLDKPEQEMKLWFIIKKQWQMYIGKTELFMKQ
ncbi:3499_t:CDS:10 [Acaulospora morrowiae]|uniref:3499_t:CDS:1 n=1 Tax=Acaulospora morrowiae TaxID=94023 RepID=A0A9N9F5T2_9GLOM|nr:3499_t:CDS:10 [Acaulospora morrowiae]